MFEAKAELSRSEFEIVETLIFELEGMEHWNLYENFEDKGYWLQGIFETREEAELEKLKFDQRGLIQNDLLIREMSGLSSDTHPTNKQ